MKPSLHPGTIVGGRTLVGGNVRGCRATRPFFGRKSALHWPCNHLRGMTLVEMFVAVGVGAVVVAMVLALYLFSMRSFASLGNYTEMDTRSRMSLDLMTLEMRQSSAVVGFHTNASARWLKLTNGIVGKVITYAWDPVSQVMTTTTNGVTATNAVTVTNLTGCTSWSFTTFQRTPTNNNWAFAPTTDTNTVKLINMRWTCIRTNALTRVNSESITEAQVMIRNN